MKTKDETDRQDENSTNNVNKLQIFTTAHLRREKEEDE